MAVNVIGEKYEENNLLGTDVNEVIKGGTVNDTITGGLGNDTITGGTGENTINYTFNANNGNDVINLTKGENLTIKIDSLTNIKYEYSSNKKDLIIYKEKDSEGNYVESITLKNFASKDFTNNSTKKTENTSSVILTDEITEVDLRNDRYLVGSSKILPEKSFTGTWLSEEINAKDLDEKFDKKGNLLPYSSKGITLDGKGGNDKIYGSWYSDTIKGGDGNDEIYGEMGNDIITGGTGENYIGHYFSQGNDVINLTKGENLTIALLDSSLTISKVGFEFVNKNRDLKIYNKENESQYFTIKNFVAKDVTNNSNAKKGIEDTSSVELKINGETYDLRNAIYDINGDIEKDYFYQIKTEKNYTGSWLNEEISASSLQKFDKKGNPLAYSSKGLSLNGGNGNDSIVGSRYSDTIKGGNGDDVIDGGLGNDNITGGAGENLIKYKKGDGNDVINLTKGENFTLSLEDVTDISKVGFEFVNKNKDLRIYTDELNKNEYITIKNFVAKDVTNNGNAKKGTEDTSSVELKIGSETYDLREYLYNISTTKSYTGSWLNEQIDASSAPLGKKNKGVTIKGNGGDDKITGSSGNDTITGGVGENTIFSTNGHDVINLTKGEILNLTLLGEPIENLNFAVASNKKDLVITLKNDVECKKQITLKNYYAKDLGATVKINGIDLATKTGFFEEINSANYFEATSKMKKSYTGSALADVVDASDLSKATNVKTLAGVTINGGAGDDILTGSDYKDVIKGGNGDDVITSGVGSDKLYGEAGKNFIKFYENDGLDTVYSGKGEDTVVFENEKAVDITFEQVKKDLIIHYGNDDAVTLKDYFTLDKKGNITGIKSSVKNITTEEGTFNIEEVRNGTAFITGEETITGTEKANLIFGSEKDDVITGGEGDDIISGAEGKNTYILNSGDGKDIITSTSNEDTLKFNDITLDSIDIIKNGDDLTLSNGDDEVTLKDAITNNLGITVEDKNSDKYNLQAGTGTLNGTDNTDIIYVGDSNSTITSGNGDDKIILGNGDNTVDTGDGADYIISGTGENEITAGKGDDVIDDKTGSDKYIFSKGDGKDILNITNSNDIIKFNDVEITDITFGEYDLENKTVTLSYGTSDTLTINGLSTDRNTVKIEDSTGTQYTVFVGDGNQTTLKPNAGENVVFINSTGRDSFMGNTGVNIFTDCSNTYDGITGSQTGTNIFLIRPEKDTGMYAWGQNDKIILKDLELSDLVYDFDNSYGYVYITNTKNSQKIQLQNFASFGVNPTIVDKNGDTTTVCEAAGIILGDVGTSGDDIIISKTVGTNVYGKGGSDFISASANNTTIYTYDKDLKNTTAGSSVTVKTNDNYTYTIYAQSEENIILNQSYKAKGTYYAYSDQKTSITENNDQTKSTDSVLNIMNTDNVNDKDGVHTGLSIIFNVDKGYTAASGVVNVGDVHIVDATNLSAWVNGNDFKGVTIKDNVVETINSSDGYSITSTQIAQLAETVATWLSEKGYNDVQAVLDGGITDDINTLTTYFAQDNNWTAPTP